MLDTKLAKIYIGLNDRNIIKYHLVIWLIPNLLQFGGLYLQMGDYKQARLTFLLCALLSESVVVFWVFQTPHGVFVWLPVFLLATLITLTLTILKFNYVKRNQVAQIKTQALPNIELKKQANQLSDDMLRFIADRTAIDPLNSFSNNFSNTKNPKSPAAIKRANEELSRQTDEGMKHHMQMRNDFFQRFAVRYETIRIELEKRGINSKDINNFRYIGTNPLSMKEGAIQIGAMANQLPDFE